MKKKVLVCPFCGQTVKHNRDGQLVVHNFVMGERCVGSGCIPSHVSHLTKRALDVANAVPDGISLHNYLNHKLIGSAKTPRQ